MLYHLLRWLTDSKPYAHEDPLFRGALAVLIGFMVVWALGPTVIRQLIRLKVGDRAEFDHGALNRLTQSKKNTPTMGGVLILIAIVCAVLILADLTNFYIRMALFCSIWLGLVGGIDDWLKLTASRRSGTRDGLRTWEKLIFQIGLGALLAIFILRYGEANMFDVRYHTLEPTISAYNRLAVPFYKHGIELSTPAFAIITVVVIAGTSNAVNLTDGMDGLASGCMTMTALTFMILAYVVGSVDVANYLLFDYVAGTAELAVVCGAVAGACLGFMWYNAYPAQVFMGDTGALPLGGLMGFVAIVTRLELMLLIVGGVFVIEAVSVLIQVYYFKRTGKRVFRCAPIHHHFHLSGWTETQTVIRFWLIAALFAAFALATIKLR